MTDSETQKVQQALDSFQIETPSWGFADTGTRFGKFLQDAAAIDINDKLADAGQVHAFTGFCPSVAVHVLWDFSPNRLFPKSGPVRNREPCAEIWGPHRGDQPQSIPGPDLQIRFDLQSRRGCAGRSDRPFIGKRQHRNAGWKPVDRDLAG